MTFSGSHACLPFSISIGFFLLVTIVIIPDVLMVSDKSYQKAILIMFTVYLYKLDTCFFLNKSIYTDHRPTKPFEICSAVHVPFHFVFYFFLTVEYIDLLRQPCD